MLFWIYILKCSDGSYYTGHTDSLELRIAQHMNGEVASYTSERLPVELVYCAEFHSREEAISRELQIKGWSRKKKEALIKNDWEEIARLAKSKR